MTAFTARKESASAAAAESGRRRFLVVARGAAKFCFGLRHVSEVGRIAHLTRMDGPYEAFLGSTILHGLSASVIDVASAIGAVRDTAEEPRMFAAVHTQPPICIGIDEILGIRECGDGSASERPHALVEALVTMDGQSLPVIDVSAATALAHRSTGAATEERRGDRMAGA